MRVIVEDSSGRITINSDTGTPVAEWNTAGVVSGRLVKSVAPKRFTLCVAYPCLRPDSQKAADGFQDVVSADVLEEAAHNYLLKHRKVGLWHAPGDSTVGAGDVVESYIWRADPWVVKAVDGSEQTVYPGDWMLGVIWSPKTWPMIGREVQGLSMQGAASRRKPSRELLSQIRK